jgi:hypothetical protein
MKKTILILMITLVGYVNAQEKFTFSKDGFNSLYLVTEVENLSQSELYNKTLNYIKTNYNNPDEVIISKIENEMIRFKGIKKGASNYMAPGDLMYEVQIDFKDGKYKFELSRMSFNIANGGYKTFDLNSQDKWYKKNGSLRAWFGDKVQAISKTMNDLNQSIKYSFTNSEDKEW